MYVNKRNETFYKLSRKNKTFYEEQNNKPTENGDDNRFMDG